MPNTPGSARNNATSEAQSPPIASDTARSSTILPGSWTARGLRHGTSTLDKPSTKPTRSAVRNSNTAPACDTTPEPCPSTFSDGYHDIDSLTERVLLKLRYSILDKSNYRSSEHPFPNSGAQHRN